MVCVAQCSRHGHSRASTHTLRERIQCYENILESGSNKMRGSSISACCFPTSPPPHAPHLTLNAFPRPIFCPAERIMRLPCPFVLRRALVVRRFSAQTLTQTASPLALPTFATISLTAPAPHVVAVTLNRPEKLNAMNKVTSSCLCTCG